MDWMHGLTQRQVTSCQSGTDLKNFLMRRSRHGHGSVYELGVGVGEPRDGESAGYCGRPNAVSEVGKSSPSSPNSVEKKSVQHPRAFEKALTRDFDLKSFTAHNGNRSLSADVLLDGESG
jgi:hypothetical protein